MDPITALIMLGVVILLAYLIIILPLMVIKALIGIPVSLVRATSRKNRRRK